MSYAIIGPENRVHSVVAAKPVALKVGYRAIPIVQGDRPEPTLGMTLQAPQPVSVGDAVSADATEIRIAWVEIPSPVPRAVSAFQARAALSRAGLLSAVEVAIAGMEDPEAALAWEYAVEFQRSGALLNAVAGGIGLTDAQIDNLFRTAAAIEA